MFTILIGLLLVVRNVHCYPQFPGSNHRRKCGRVHLTVSSLQENNLELNWITDCQPDDVQPDYIILSSKNLVDSDENSIPLAKIRAAGYPSGFYKTNVRFAQSWTPGNWDYDASGYHRAIPGPHCYPYWITSIRNNHIIDTQCLAIQPTWMNDNRAQLAPLKIGSAFIPGTHNSGSFNGVPSFLQNYILNQDRDIWTQLIFGIRYLDFRIGFYEHDGFFINHDLVRITKVQPLFKQIRKFLEWAPKEIVILDFHRFPYPSKFNMTLHRKFIDLLYEELGDLALPAEGLQVGKGPTFNEIWAQNKNLIICYADRNTVRDNYWLWHPLQQYWGNTKKVDYLKKFLSNSIKEHRVTINPMWALMAELTPQPIDLLFRTNNLRKLADDVNKQLTRWFRDEWANDVNIVATDYFLGNDLINVAIEKNTNK